MRSVTRSGSQSSYSTVKCSHTFFENISGRIHESGVDIPKFFQPKKIGSMFCTVKGVYGGTRGCISTVVTNSTALAKADYILLEGGVNDAWNNAPVGTLTDGFAAAYDETTMTGALEKMLDDLETNYSDKCVAYVFPHGGMFAGSENWYKTYKPAILAALKKWGVPYVDIAETTPPMGKHGVSELGDKYTSDGTHPNAAGYERFYAEPIAALLKRL